MKYIIVIIALFISYHLTAQSEVYNNTFVRIYNLESKKINKGKLQSVSTTSMELYVKGETVTILLNEIGEIKTKRSGGHNIGTGALMGLLFGDDDEGLLSFSATDKALFGLISGGALDAIVGGITALF